jgi:predicted transcriptional regulator
LEVHVADQKRLAEEKHRDELTREALAQVDAGETYTHEEVLAYFQQRKRERHEAAKAGVQTSA